jgi:hypothetical protein
MTRDPEQATADLRRAVRRLVEGASAEQLEAMRAVTLRPGRPVFLPPGDAVLVDASGLPLPRTDNERPVTYESIEFTARAGTYEMPAEQTATIRYRENWPAAFAPPAFTPGQRVTIPARYCGEGCHGVRVGTVAIVESTMLIDDDEEAVGVRVPGYDGMVWVAESQVEAA